MSLESYRAFACRDCDYYELQEDLGELLSKGAIFVHDRNNCERGSIAEGCLLLCWTPEGNCYGGTGNCGLAGETVVFHADFAKSSLFRFVSGPSFKGVTTLDSLSLEIEGLKQKLDRVLSEIAVLQRHCK